MKKNIVILLGLGLQVLPFIAADRAQKLPQLVSLRALLAASGLGQDGLAQAPEGVELPGAVPSVDRVPSDDHTWSPVGQGVGPQQVGFFHRQGAFFGSSAGSEIVYNPAPVIDAEVPGAGVGGHLFNLGRPVVSSADDAQIYHAGNDRLPRLSSRDQGTFSQASIGSSGIQGSLQRGIQADARAAAVALGVPAHRPVEQAAPRGLLDCCSIQ